MAGRFIHLIGFPGVGKLTIARHIVGIRPDIILVDNHLINNPIFKVIGYNGRMPLPAGIWAKIADIRGAVLSAIDAFSPVEASFYSPTSPSRMPRIRPPAAASKP